MKTKIEKLILAFLVLLLISISGCNKDDEQELTRTQLLTRNWNITYIDGLTVTDFCGLDAVLLYINEDHTLILKAILGKESYSIDYTWNWEGDEDTIFLSSSNSYTNWKVQKLDENDLWFTDISDGMLYKCKSFD